MAWAGLYLIALIGTSLSTEVTHGQEASFKETMSDIELESGDTLVFLGDSITHQCLYTQYVEDYFYTRYPNRRIHFHNAGVSGDRAADALIRLEDDVLQFKPKYATILLGMNDGTYTNFQQNIFDTYEKDMTELLERLQEADIKAIPMTPTMFDSRAAKIRDKGNNPRTLRNDYYNAVLSFYGMWLQEQAFARGLGFVDMHSPLNDITIEQRKTDASFTLIQDAVHPGPDGQVIMALAVLEDMHANRQVSNIQGVKNRKGEWKINASGGEVSDIIGSEDSLKFTFTAESLPWVLPADAAEGFKLAKANQKVNREQLRIAGLDLGKQYTLSIDGVSVGKYWPQRLADGITLQGNAKTPQYKQALAVAMLNKQRNEEAYRKIRGLWSKRKGMRRAIARAKSDTDKDTKREELNAWLPEFNQQLAEYQELAKSFEDKIYEANQPVPHVYELSR